MTPKKSPPITQPKTESWPPFITREQLEKYLSSAKPSGLPEGPSSTSSPSVPDQGADVLPAMNTEPVTVFRYVEAIGRNEGEELQHSHLYAELSNGDYEPMCLYGWNRSDGQALSIFRGHRGARGCCKTCRKRADAGLRGVPPTTHKTKWL